MESQSDKAFGSMSELEIRGNKIIVIENTSWAEFISSMQLLKI